MKSVKKMCYFSANFPFPRFSLQKSLNFQKIYKCKSAQNCTQIENAAKQNKHEHSPNS